MRDDQKSRQVTARDILHAGLTGVSILALTFFCYVIGYSLMIPLFVFFLGLHIYFINKARLELFFHLGLLLALIVFITHALSFYTDLSFYYIPVAGIAMLTVLLFNSLYLSFIMAIGCSVIVSLILGGDLGMMLTFFMGSISGVYIVRNARTRGQIIYAAFVVSFVNEACALLLNPSTGLIMAKEFLVRQVYPLLANGFISAFFVAATLKVFEIMFGVLTNFSLLELGDRNQPLLKRMALEAPGTWQHSLIVSQLAEAAAEAVDANALLARTGAYYHDIGKLSKSEYFTENQLATSNKHDKIEPSMSRLVLLNHVKEGVELAKKYKLNPLIADFIPQHHGTGLMYFFYQKALEDAGEGEIVNEEDYRYPGPKPRTKETAITLLADSVEGAVRALDEATPNRIEETVKKIVNNKFIDGQLDECNLTLNEINIICAAFTRILSAMYHGRVKYPEKIGKNGHNIKKPAEKNPPESPADQAPGPGSA